MRLALGEKECPAHEAIHVHYLRCFISRLQRGKQLSANDRIYSKQVKRAGCVPNVLLDGV